MGFNTLCPTPGTTTRCPCGNNAVTAAASAVGVRKSRPPLNASIGTFGRGPAPSGAFPAGEGQSSHSYERPSRAAHAPNGPNEPAGKPATAALRIEVRADGGVSGDHGNTPSAQLVATLRPKLRSLAGKIEL